MEYKRIESKEEFEKEIGRINGIGKNAVLDLETTGLDRFSDTIIDIQLCSVFDNSVLVAPGGLSRSLLALDVPYIVGHNLKFDYSFLFHNGCDLLGKPYLDTLLLGHLLDENRDSYSLDSYIKERYQDDYKEKFWEKYEVYCDAPEVERWGYGARDVAYTARLFQDLRRDLALDGIPDELVKHVHSLQYALLRTEIHGVSVDLAYLARLGCELKGKIELLKPKMRGLVSDWAELIELEMWDREMEKRKTEKGKAGVKRPGFSFDSSKQLVDLFYSKLKLPTQKNEKTKNVSVDDASLEKLKDLHAIVPLVQEYRGLNKIQGTYIEGTLERVKDGKIYPEFRVNGTVTGRISHSNPNLGQLPKVGGVRGIYRAERGRAFISADYSQLEVCIEANLTQDSKLIEIFEKGLSKHDITARELRLDRDKAKTLNFCLQYWGTHFKVAKLLKVDEKKALEIWTNYWKVYSGPKKLKAQTDKMVDEGQPLVSLFGRKRRFEQRKRSPWDGDYRAAYNFLIQSCGADITSKAFYRISNWLEEAGYGRGLWTVHDEILIEVDSDKIPLCESRLLGTMVGVGIELGLKIPLKAESSGGMERWED